MFKTCLNQGWVSAGTPAKTRGKCFFQFLPEEIGNIWKILNL